MHSLIRVWFLNPFRLPSSQCEAYSQATPHIHERHVFDATNRYGEIEPKQETALEELGYELPDPEKKRSKTNNRKVVFDSACRTMFLDICKRHGLELDEEPSYDGRKYLETR